MSLIDVRLSLEKSGRTERITNPLSLYQPSGLEKERLMMIRQNFAEGDVVKKRPRREFNDLSELERTAIDQMSFGVYQPNDGDALAGDTVNSWRSNAVRPIVRNKIISIAAHVCARTMFPRIFAFNESNDEEKDSGTAMSDLIEYSILNTNAVYADVSVQSTVSALVNPISWVYTQYQEVFRTVKRGRNEDGSWITEKILDENFSGIVDESVPPDQMYYGEFYIPNGDVQLQPWLIRRRIRNYQTARELYGRFPNFQHVRPGVQIVFNDANQQFYEAYDITQRQNEVEEVLYWNKALDLYLIVVNGCLLSDPDNPNPREDKLYPFATFGYELLRANGDCMAYKSLAFKTMPDEKVVNSIYPMVIDGTYLAIFPPMVAIGPEVISSDVIIPGEVTTLQDENADLKPLLVASENLRAGFEALFKVEENITESSIDKQELSEKITGGETAYQISKAEQHAKIILGGFLNMQARYIKQMGRLRIGDIKQYYTLPQVSNIEGDPDFVYKTFLMQEGNGRQKGRKIKFDLDLPEGEITEGERLEHSYNVLEEQGGHESPYQLYKINPRLFRKLKYLVYCAPDVISPMSEELESRLMLEEYDRAIRNPILDPEQVTKDFLLSAYRKSKKDPEKYIRKNSGSSMGVPELSTGGLLPSGGQGL